jgi:hypothetical protein
MKFFILIFIPFLYFNSFSQKIESNPDTLYLKKNINITTSFEKEKVDTSFLKIGKTDSLEKYYFRESNRIKIKYENKK